MTGEMPRIDPVTGETPDGEVYALHAAIARAVGGTVQPFDKYQGPYVLIGPDVRIGDAPYEVALKGLGVVRLWIVDAGDGFANVYREDTDTSTRMPFFADGPWAERDAVAAAREVLGEWSGDPCPVAPDSCWIDQGTGEHVAAADGSRGVAHRTIAEVLG